jgi:hypothetical protein
MTINALFCSVSQQEAQLRAQFLPETSERSTDKIQTGNASAAQLSLCSVMYSTAIL